MNKKYLILIFLTLLLYNLLLFFKLIVTAFFLIFDEYYRVGNFNNPDLFQTKHFNLSFYSIIIPILLTLIIAFYIGKKIKKNYLIIISAYIIAFICFRFSYFKIFNLFSITDNSFINMGILSIPIILMIIVSLKKIKIQNS